MRAFSTKLFKVYFAQNLSKSIKISVIIDEKYIELVY